MNTNDAPVEIINLTSVDVVICTPEGVPTHTFKRSGVVAEMTTTTQPVDAIGGVPSVRVHYGAVANLPEPRPDTYYVVSMPVGLQHGTGRTDLIGPNTNEAVRDPTAGNRIVGVPNFVRY